MAGWLYSAVRAYNVGASEQNARKSSVKNRHPVAATDLLLKRRGK